MERLIQACEIAARQLEIQPEALADDRLYKLIQGVQILWWPNTQGTMATSGRW
jgi:hypothetical protein